MKVFALVLLCAFVAVQGRSPGVKNTRTVAALGENPYVVHLRIAVEATGLLSTCGGSIIGNTWLLTAASCIADQRFIWVRYGTVNVLNPSLVTENTLIRVHPGYSSATGANNIGLININRVVHSTENIAPIRLSYDEASPESGKLCVFGEESGAPGELLRCSEVALELKDDDLLVGSDLEASRFNIGAALVSDGVQVALLVGAEDGVGTFLPVASYVEWIEGETGLVLSPEVPTTPSAEEEAEPEEESRSVKFVN